MTSSEQILELRSEATVARGRAAAARALALELERRRWVVLSRDDEAQLRHTAQVWSSHAATQSRTELQTGIRRSLWSVGEHLTSTRVALETRARELESEASSLLRRAVAAEAEVDTEVQVGS